MTMTTTMTIAEIEEYFNSFPAGYKFDPSDEELIIEYLLPKMKGREEHVNLMHDVNIYEHNPDYLAEKYCPQGNKGWYFFTPRDKKYPKGSRPNRRAGDGYWKATGADKAIHRDGIEVGSRRALVFYKGRPPKGEKTLWIMHEFQAAGPSQVKKRKHGDGKINMRLDDYILCRIYKKNVLNPKDKSQRKQEAENESFESQVNDTIEGEIFSKRSPVFDDINRGGHNVNVYTNSYNYGDYPSVQPLIGSIPTNQLMANVSISGMNGNPSTTNAELFNWDPYQTYGNYNFSEDFNGDYEHSLLPSLLDLQNSMMANPDLDLDLNPNLIDMSNPPLHVIEEIEVKDVLPSTSPLPLLRSMEVHGSYPIN